VSDRGGVVADDAANHRYTITVDGEVAGFIDYHDRGSNRAMLHTEVNDAFEGHGLGSTLVSAALDDARSRGLAVLPYCPFVRSYLASHPAYVDLVPPDRRGEFDLLDTA